jgi:hypothetical protein
MARAPSAFRQQDVTRAINAAKRAGLDIVRVEVDARANKIALIIAQSDKNDTVRCESWADAPMPQIGKRKQK